MATHWATTAMENEIIGLLFLDCRCTYEQDAMRVILKERREDTQRYIAKKSTTGDEWHTVLPSACGRKKRDNKTVLRQL